MGVQRQQKRKPRSNALGAPSMASRNDKFFPYLHPTAAKILHEHTTIIIYIEPVDGKPDHEALRVSLAKAIKKRGIIIIAKPRDPKDTEENHRFFHAHMHETGQAVYPGYLPISYDDIVGVIYDAEVQAASFKAAKAAIPVKGFPLSRTELEGYFRNDAALMGIYGRLCAKWRRPDDSILGLPGAVIESEHSKAIVEGQQEAARNRHDWRTNGPDIDPPNDNNPLPSGAPEYPSDDVSMPSASSSSSIHLRPDSDTVMRTASSRSSSEAPTVRANLEVIRAGKQRMHGERREAPKGTEDEHFGAPYIYGSDIQGQRNGQDYGGENDSQEPRAWT